MKRLGFFTLLLIIFSSMYYDLTIGTLPPLVNSPSTVEAAENNTLPDAPYEVVVVEPGYTVLSIVEHLHTEPIRATIQEIVYDFSQLNDGLAPEDIQIGESYRFPIYGE
ncbi:hypothetical protein P4637_19785 [Halalkalibacterium halodurans]|uniref:BH1402 protein n=2 Tax=Halalkalibacterium halodurans TaxID=86665 RepID=Q9KD17_HALH5|nr:hypothetical protein [Halalkalibacterium halodurans]MDY7221926.1 hypothetical protein [Halalkalibacterium halodurans]MDY7241202.1 hypothetical protein [Halalkalibacterium halodurans]MED3647043.1 hypothetical protein [Halalkalibacterium halodurans]MED4081768.1 hypothetical protein [Halalkalibacterium halodurans]MED4087062.1 hypothetical protein [Halalkalibacterium halodurans]